MFLGHMALAFAAKRVTPRVSLAMLLVAAQWADLLWPVLVALGIEQVRIEPGNTAFTPLAFVSYPYSHSLLALGIWGCLIGLGYRGIAGGRRAFWVLAALVVSHWVLDIITHRPDLPLYAGGPLFGLGLWNSVPATIAVECAMYGAGVWIYAASTSAIDVTGRWAFPGLAALLLLVYVGNVVSEPPSSVTTIWVAAIVGGGLVTLWAWWADRHRVAVRG